MKYRLKGFDKLLSQLANSSNAIVFMQECEKALLKGGDVVADKTRQELEGIKPDDRRYVEGQRESIRSVQKAALLKGFGISPVQLKSKNAMDIKTGVNRAVNKLGQPNVVIARRLENGTSYMKKNPVFSRGTRKARNECLKEMESSLNNSINKLWNR